MPSSSRPKVALPRPRGRGKRALTVWVWILGFCLAALIATYMMFVEPPPPHKIVIASGGQNGAYFRYAQKYAEELQKDGLSVEVRETAGSVENLRLLGQEGSGVAVAIVQSGVASPEDVKHFDALGSLYREPLWVFYRGDKRLDRLSQLAGKRIGVGPPGSGTHAIAVQLLAVNGVVESKSSSDNSRTVFVQEEVAAAAKALQKGELDAAFFVAAFEADYIQSLLHDSGVNLLSFDQHEAYHRRFRFLAPITVPAGLVNLGRNIPGRDVVAAGADRRAGRSQGFPPRSGPAPARDRHAHPRQGRRAFRTWRVPLRLVLRLPRESGCEALLQVRPARAAAATPFLGGLAGRSGQGDAHPGDHADDAVAPGCAAADALANQAQDLPLVF